MNSKYLISAAQHNLTNKGTWLLSSIIFQLPERQLGYLLTALYGFSQTLQARHMVQGVGRRVQASMPTDESGNN